MDVDSLVTNFDVRLEDLLSTTSWMNENSKYSSKVISRRSKTYDAIVSESTTARAVDDATVTTKSSGIFGTKRRRPQPKDIIISEDWNGVNTGIFMVGSLFYDYFL